MTDKYINYIYDMAEKATRDIANPTEKHIRDAVGSIGYCALEETGLLDQLYVNNKNGGIGDAYIKRKKNAQV